MGIQPVFAQTEKTIDMESVSDSEFTEAVEASSDIELINKADTQPSEQEPALTEEKPPAEPAPAETSTQTQSGIAKETTTDTEQEVSGDIRNNEHLQESQRLAQLAEDAYEFGDYDASSSFAEAAIQAAQLSDEYVTQQTGIPAGMAADAPAADGTFPLPGSYTVRAWNVSHDCFWNIAGRPWVYGDPHKWRVLYNANKAKLPDPNNPNLIEAGIVLDIPNLKGEVRQGAWDGNKKYKPLK
jgi:nucleoid-associated protein YgaU